MTRRRTRPAPPDTLSLYAAYAEIRADYAPVTCDGGRQCWVRDGPPSLSGNNPRPAHCLGCGGSPRPRFARQWWPPR